MSTHQSTRKKKAVIMPAPEAAASVPDGIVKKVPSDQVIITASMDGSIQKVSKWWSCCCFYMDGTIRKRSREEVIVAATMDGSIRILSKLK